MADKPKATPLDLWKEFGQLDPESQICSALTDFDEKDIRWLENHDHPSGRSFAKWLRMCRKIAEAHPHLALRAWLQHGLFTSDGMTDADIDRAAPLTPRWPSTLRDLDDATGGFYGITLISGETGCGKSTLATASAFEAALDGLHVVYLNAELDTGTLRWFVSRYFVNKREDRERALGRIRFINARPGVRLIPFVMRSSLAIPQWARRMLVVIDSLNTIVQMSPQGEEDYFGELNRWLMWAMEVRRISEGRIGFIIISELNKRGETVGAKGNYVADLLLYLKRGGMDGHVHVNVVKGRYSGPHDIGELYLDHRSGRFRGKVDEEPERREMGPVPADYQGDFL